MTPLILRIVSLVAVILIAFGAGWKVKSALIAERDLAILEAKNEFINEYRMNEAGKAQVLEKKLADLRANERTIEREKLKIIDRPVYLNTCLDADGLRLIEAARAGKTDTAESTDKVSGAK